MKQAVEYSPIDNFCLKYSVLYKLTQGHELLVVPQAIHNQIMQDTHSKRSFLVQKTDDLNKIDYYPPNLLKVVQTVTANCVPYILPSNKSGKLEGFFQPIPKGDTPLDTYHIDFLGPLPSTNKNYNYLLIVVYAFTKFLWIYSFKSILARDALDKLRLISDVRLTLA